MLDIFLNDPFNIDKLSKKTSFFASVYFYVSFSIVFSAFVNGRDGGSRTPTPFGTWF